MWRVFVDEFGIHLYFPQSELQNFDRLLCGHLFMNSFHLDCYYGAINDRNKLTKINSDLNDTHRAIRGLINESLQLSFYSIHRHYKISRKLEKLISQHYSMLLDYSENAMIFRESAETADKLLSESSILGHFRAELTDELKHDTIDVDTLTKCTDCARDVVQKSYTAKVTLLGAPIAIVGSIIGTLILEFIRAQTASPSNSQNMTAQIISLISTIRKIL